MATIMLLLIFNHFETCGLLWTDATGHGYLHKEISFTV